MKNSADLSWLFGVEQYNLRAMSKLPGWVNLSVKTLERIVALYPGELSLWNDLGVQYLTRGSNEEAREAFLKVSQIQI